MIDLDVFTVDGLHARDIEQTWCWSILSTRRFLGSKPIESLPEL